MRVVPLILIGHGGVGKAFLKQIEGYAQRHGAEAPIRFLTAAIVTSRSIARHAALEIERGPDDWDSVTRVAAEAELLYGHRPVIVDATAGADDVPHLRWIEAGFTVVTANKRPLTGPLETFHRLTAAIDPRGHRSYWFEATVGAGLPVVREIRELVETGDRITRIDAVLSGTLNFLCAARARGEPFGEAVLAAMAKGLAEPDPREDLKCEDVARKAMILGRLAGMRIEDVRQLHVLKLLDDAHDAQTRDEFLDALPSAEPWPSPWPHDALHEYVVTIKPQAGTVRGRLKPRNLGRSPLVGPENRFSIATERNGDVPVVIRGPGAGRDVTATAMFGDLLRSIARL